MSSKPHHQPRVHVVTLVKDDRTGLLRTGASILRQDYPEVLWHVVPAASEAEWLDSSYSRGRVVIHEGGPQGIYPSMDWVLRQLPENEFVLFLNARDFFLCQEAISLLVQGASAGDWSSSYFAVSTRTGWIRSIVGWGTEFESIDVGHQSTLSKVGDLHDLGGFDASYSIFADSQLLRRLREHRRLTVVPQVLVNYERGGYSSRHPLRQRRELARLDSEVPLSGTLPAPDFKRSEFNVARVLFAPILDTLSRGRMPGRSMKERREQIFEAMSRSKHWGHSRVHLDSVRCCMDSLLDEWRR